MQNTHFTYGYVLVSVVLYVQLTNSVALHNLHKTKRSTQTTMF